MEEIEKREPVKRKRLTKKQEEYLKTALFLEMFAELVESLAESLNNAPVR